MTFDLTKDQWQPYIIEGIKMQPSITAAIKRGLMREDEIKLNTVRTNYLCQQYTFNALWLRFSEIQCATWITVTGQELERFRLWLSTGDDNDAWS